MCYKLSIMIDVIIYILFEVVFTTIITCASMKAFWIAIGLLCAIMGTGFAVYNEHWSAWTVAVVTLLVAPFLGTLAVALTSGLPSRE